MAAYDFTGLYRFESPLAHVEEGDASLPARPAPGKDLQRQVDRMLRRAGVLGRTRS
jgi:hypothetical protein